MASIRTKRLANGQSAYLVRFRSPDGSERTKQFRRRRDAERYANLIEIDRLQGNFVDPRLGKITVEEWFERWWPTVTNLRPSTRARDEASFRSHVLPAFGAMPLARLDRTSLREWVGKLSESTGSNLAPATVVKAVQVFNKVMRAALEDRLISVNPVERLPIPKIEREEMRFLTADELWHLAETIDPRYRAFVLLGGYGGLRLGEMLGLRWGRVNLLRREVTVAETLVDLAGTVSFGPPKTKAAGRTVGVPSFVADELSKLADVPVESDHLVFVSPEGQVVRPGLFRRRFWNPAVDRAGLSPFRIHDLRHTAVALWIAAGANPKQIAVRAGHTSVAVVLDRYGHLYPQQEAALLSALEGTLPRRTANEHVAAQDLSQAHGCRSRGPHEVPPSRMLLADARHLLGIDLSRRRDHPLATASTSTETGPASAAGAHSRADLVVPWRADQRTDGACAGQGDADWSLGEEGADERP